ncbi:MAG: tetratricopeptide repeat protein [Acidobacteriota bacterium]
MARQEALDRAAAALEAILRVEPDNLVALSRLAGVMEPGATRRLAMSLRLADLRPTSAGAQVNAARVAMQQGDLDIARRYVDRARELRVPLTHYGPSAAVWLSLYDANEAWLSDDLRKALDIADAFEPEARKLSPDLTDHATAQLFLVYLSLGRLQQAERLIHTWPSWVEPIVRDQQQGRVLALRGDQRKLAHFLSQRFRSAESARFVGSNLIDAGLLEAARRVIAYHQQHGNRQAYEWYSGQLALAEGRVEEAIRRLTVAAGLFPSMTNQGLKIARQLADAHHAAGHPDEAIRILQRATRQRSELAHGWEWLRARDRLSALYTQAGRRAEADAVDHELSVLLSVADDDHVGRGRLAERRGGPGAAEIVAGPPVLGDHRSSDRQDKR